MPGVTVRVEWKSESIGLDASGLAAGLDRAYPMAWGFTVEEVEPTFEVRETYEAEQREQRE